MPTDRPLEMFLICTKKRIGPKTVPWGTPDSTLDRAEKSAEAFREQKFNRMCVPEVCNQLLAIFLARATVGTSLYVLLRQLVS